MPAGQELRTMTIGGVAFVVSPTEPTGRYEGLPWYDTSQDAAKVWVSGAWVTTSGGDIVFLAQSAAFTF